MKKAKKFVALLTAAMMIFNMGTVITAHGQEPTETKWRQVDPDNIQIGKSYLVVSENGALVNAQATISTPGDVTGDTQIGMGIKPVTIEDGLITSEVTNDMVWQFGLGDNTAAASGELGGNSGYYLLNDAPGEGGGTEPLRRESSFNAQFAPINTTGAAINGNQQTLMLYDLNDGTNAVSLYYWSGSNQWNFVLTGQEDGFTAKSPVASGTSAEQMLELMQQNKLWLYEPDVDTGVEYYVMATAGANGSISPTSQTGHVWVGEGEDVTFTFTPDFGYEVDKVTVNGEEVAVTGNTYTIENVMEDGIEINVTFKAAENAKDVPFIVYNDIFSVGNVTTAVIIDLGEGNEANLSDLSADMFSVSARNTRYGQPDTVIFDGTRQISRVYVNDQPEPLGYSKPAPGSDDLVTDTPESGRYIVIELEFWNENGYLSGAMVSGNLQNAYSADLNYSINANRALELTNGESVTPFFVQEDVVNLALDKFVHDSTNPGGEGDMSILVSVDDSWEEEGPLPVFIYNHGAGRGGSNGDDFAPVQTANGGAMLAKMQVENPDKYHAHIIVTQNHTNNEANNAALIAYIEKMADEGMVDLDRIYMSGFSMGSMYTASFYSRHPDFLAAIALQSGGNLPSVEELEANPEYGKTAIWAVTHEDDFMGTTWTEYFSEGGAGASGLYENANCNVLYTNRAFNFPYYGYDWTPHETEAQNYSNLRGQMDSHYSFGPDQEAYADKNIFDWLFDQTRGEKEETTNWRPVDPDDVQVGKSYLVVSENGALVNAQATISTPGDVTGDTQIGMGIKPVTIEDGLITSEVTNDMVWQFGLGDNTAAASGELGGNSGYYLLNDAPGEGGGTEPLRRESSFNAQFAPINTTGAAINGNQQTLMLYDLNDGTNAVSLYYWSGSNQWNFVLTGQEDGFTAKSPVASGTSAEQMLELMQQNKLWLYEPDVDTGVEYYVMATAGANGSISPTSQTGHVWVGEGEDVTFTFTPDFGYEVDKVTVNGEEVAVTDNTYTIENVMEDGIEINVTFKASENAKDVPFIVYNDIFEVGNVTTAVIIDLGEGNEANLSDLSADMFSVSARNTRYGMPDTVIFDGSRKISRVYVNNEAKPLGYITPAPGSDDLVTDTPETGRYIVVELEFWDNNGYLSGAMVSGNLQNAYSADLNYSISINSAIELTNGESVIPFFVQEDVVNLTLDKFVHDSTNPGGAGDMDILISIDDSWEEEGPLPLFIYNHGGGRGGSKGDYFAPMQTANGAAVLAKLQMENPDKYKIHIIATQNHSNNQTNNEALMAYVQKLVEEGKVDPDRVYMSGFSMGGMYTMDFYKRNPEFLAAIVPLACATFPTAEQLEENVELTKTSIWGFVHKNDPYGDGTNWPNYFTTGAGATAGYENANVSVMDTNQAFNYPYYGYDWTPHETEAQLFNNLLGQGNTLHEIGPDQGAYDDKTIFDWLLDQDRGEEEEEGETWRLVDPADVQLGKSYVVVSENGALVNAQATISTPGDVTGDTQIGMAIKPVTIKDGLITSEITPDMIWQFGPGNNTAGASGGLGGNSGYYLLNDAPGAAGGTEPLRRESSFNAQFAPINTTGAAINGNQQTLMLYDLNDGTNAVSLYYWSGSNQWNFVLTGQEDGFTAKSPVASGTSAEQMLELMQQNKLWLYEPDVDTGVEYYVMATAGANGSISPTSQTGHVWVGEGEDVTFTFTPDFGYEVDKVTVNGEEVAVTGNTYTIENVMEDGIEINVTFKAAENAKDVPFIVYNDIFSVGNVTTAVIIDLGEGNEANLSDLSADMFSVSARNTRYGMPDTVIFDGSRVISRVYVNDAAEPLGYIKPAPGSDDLVTDTPESGRYIIIELEFWNENGYLSGAMVSGNLQNAYSADLNYSISASRAIQLANGEDVIPFFVQEDVVNPALDKFVHDSTNPGGEGDMDILISIDDSWEEEGPLPVFIYNHGGGRGGSKGDYFAPVQTANGGAVLSKMQLQYPGKYNAHIIVTQNHSDNDANNKALMAYIQKLADQGMVDLDRIYMSGFSMGSMYTVGFYTRYPEFLAAIAPQSGGNLPSLEQLEENPEYGKTAIWAMTHKDDFMGTAWTQYFSEGGAGASGLYENANCNVLNTNRAFNFPYYGYDWTPHETEAQNYSNLRGQMDSLYAFGPDQEAYADKNIFDWMFDQTRADVADEADKEELNRLIAEVEGYQSEDYTADSFQALQNALEAAKAVSADEFATVSEVDEATYDLALAKNGLVPAVQKEILALAIELAEAEDTSNWTPDSAKALADAIEAGRAVLDNSEATQKEVDDAAMAIVEAMNNSVLMADKDRLAQLIEIVNQLTEDKYTASTWKVCEEKLAQANAVMDDLNATQQQVNDAYKELLNAMVSLQLKAQKAALKSALDIARTILYSADEYVESTIKGLSELVAEGEALYYNDEATQSDVDEMAKALLEAAMKARKLADKAVLQSTVEKAEAVDLTLYTADSVEVFSNALLSAKQVLANVDLSEDDQAQVDNAAMVLTKAMDDLILKTSDSDTPVDETPSTGSDSSNNSDSSNGSDSSDESESAGPATGESDTLLIVLTMMLVMSGIAFLGLRKKSWEK